ncbi:SH3 domain-containing protein [Romboutsia sedimentorum]|uniref:SH3 domain-containing protein n=1 Tax=Romboutsia sedimentorum TaxID=1368474 RepID=A0ABT7EA15_9FIRM|nr:SH3 domain-containing protein [Romboutsia sedimentorum]MDK2563765.1 SH3 domain-containing protein [Romboutsia sedimentorum]MDK2586130.1 SH3 domain-containing protein [Romboutsia sedimentorum]
MKKLKKLSLCSIGAATLTLGSILNSHAQVLQAETLQNLNLRTGPSTNNSIILTIAKGSTIEVLENSDIWAIVKYNGTVGYVSSQYIKEQLSVIKPPSEENNNNNTETILMECNVNSLNVRKGPSTSESILGKIDKTDRVYVVYQTNNGWSRIKYNSGYGYVSSQYLIKVNTNSNNNSSSNEVSDALTTMVCNTTSLNIRKGPSTSESVIGHLNKSAKVTVVEKLNNNWSKIRFNNQFGYVSSQYLSAIVSTPVANNFMKCDTYMLNVRKGPSSSENIVGNLRNGDKVEIVYHLNSGWTRIKFNNQFAYVSTTYLANI